jgi:tetratricopeptide (TPR) repeat protein
MLADWLSNKASAHLALKQYDQAIEWARRAIAINPNNWAPHWYLVVALALTGQESQAHEALQRYLAVPGVPATVAAFKPVRAQYVSEQTDPRYVEYWDRLTDGLRKAGLPEE